MTRLANHFGGNLWRPPGLVGISPAQRIPLIKADQVQAIVPDQDLWDMWPLQSEDGTTSAVGDRAFWFFLSSPRLSDPEERHDHARIRLVCTHSGAWTDLGLLFADGFSPGTREWSGSAVLSGDSQVRMFFTASGRKEGGPHFEQRIFETRIAFDPAGDCPLGKNWSEPVEIISADDIHYARADENEPIDGMVRGFRDPGYFKDPADGSEYILFTGSAVEPGTAFDGVIGVARHDADRWQLLPSLVDAVGVNKELERPHIVALAGNYYLFWSTHASRFATDITAPTGLYGMMAETFEGPWHPINGTGLVAANPSEEPSQSYCWWVTPDLSVTSFTNYYELAGRSVNSDRELARKQFGGTVAPAFQLRLDGARSQLVASVPSISPKTCG